jgi:hypothetical protein
MKNKNTEKYRQTKELEKANHHANPSHVSAEIAAKSSTDKSIKKQSHQSNSPKEDKRSAVRHLHQNGSTTSDRM